MKKAIGITLMTLLIAAGAMAQAAGKTVYTVYTNTPQGANSPAYMSDTTIGKIIADKTGVDLKFTYYVGDANTKIGVMIASGDYPDIVLASGGTAPTWIDSGAFIPLDTLLASEGKSIYTGYGDIVWKRNRNAKDGKIYTIPAFAMKGKRLPVLTIGQGFGIIKEAYEGANFPKLQTMQQYFDFIADYVKKNPTTADGQKTIGFEILRDDWRNSIQWMYEQLGAYPGDGRAVVDVKTKKVIMRDIAPDMKKLIKFLNEQNARGLIDNESFVQNYDQYVAKMASGRVVGMWDANWEFGSAADALTKAGKPGRTWTLLPLTWNKGGPLQANIQNPPSGDGTAITTKAKDPKGIMKFLASLTTDEIQVLSNWGVKGVNYSVDAKGKYVRTLEQQKAATDSITNAKVGLGSVGGYPWPSYRGTFADGNVYAPGDSPELAIATLDAFDAKFVKAWGVRVPGDLLNSTLITDYKWSPLWTIDWSKYPGKFDQVYNDSYALSQKWFGILITGKTADFEANWTKYVAEMNKLDIKGLVGTLQKELDWRMANY